MPSYGGPGLAIEYTYVAVQPFDAEHPIGSGKVVHYIPGQTFPGEDWGMAAHNLVEMGKAVRLAVNIGDGTGGGKSAPAPSPEPEPEPEVEDVTSYPKSQGFGWFMLSDGSRVRGKEDAIAAEAALEVNDA